MLLCELNSASILGGSCYSLFVVRRNVLFSEPGDGRGARRQDARVS